MSSLDFEGRKCSHLIQPSKYERNAPEIRSWWNKLFHLLEADASIPPDKRCEILREIFPRRLLDKILSILSCTEDDRRAEEQTAIATSPETTEMASTPDLGEREDKLRKEIGPKNPYMKFFRRRLDRVAIWQELPPLKLEEMNLTQKAQAITEIIAYEFVEWMNHVDDSPTSLTFQSVLKMFDIGFNTHAAKSLCVRMKEMASVPDPVARLKELPHFAKRFQLHRQIRRDIGACKEGRKLYAFGTKLPRDLQKMPPKVDVTKKWLVCERVPEDLESMATVWQGITHLRSTRAYCEYLLEHRDIKPPKYLESMKMLDPAFLKGPHYSTGDDTGKHGSMLKPPGLTEGHKSEEILPA